MDFLNIGVSKSIKKSQPNVKKTALAAGNGFAYQTYDFLDKLIECLVITNSKLWRADYEKTEDYTINFSSRVIHFQVKNINSGSPTLTSLIKEINRFWDILNNTELGKEATCFYLSTQTVDDQLIETWNKESPTNEDLKCLKEFLLKEKRIHKDIKQFIKKNEKWERHLHTVLIGKIKWRFNNQNLESKIIGTISILESFISNNNRFKGIDARILHSQLKTQFDLFISKAVEEHNKSITLTAEDVLKWCDEILRTTVQKTNIALSQYPETLSLFSDTNRIPINKKSNFEEILLEKVEVRSRESEIVKKTLSFLKLETTSNEKLIYMQRTLEDIIFAKCNFGLDKAIEQNLDNCILQRCKYFMNCQYLEDHYLDRYYVLLNDLIDLKLN